jgi:hypothetical protein
MKWEQLFPSGVVPPLRGTFSLLSFLTNVAHGACLYNGCMYVTCGIGEKDRANELYKYDIGKKKMLKKILKL